MLMEYWVWTTIAQWFIAWRQTIINKQELKILWTSVFAFMKTVELCLWTSEVTKETKMLFNSWIKNTNHKILSHFSIWTSTDTMKWFWIIFKSGIKNFQLSLWILCLTVEPLLHIFLQSMSIKYWINLMSIVQLIRINVGSYKKCLLMWTHVCHWNNPMRTTQVWTNLWNPFHRLSFTLRRLTCLMSFILKIISTKSFPIIRMTKKKKFAFLWKDKKMAK